MMIHPTLRLQLNRALAAEHSYASRVAWITSRSSPLRGRSVAVDRGDG
jgi:hypothetical protein